MNIGVIGIGYVGLGLATMLAKSNKVVCFDINKAILESLESKNPLTNDNLVKQYFKDKTLMIETSITSCLTYKDLDVVFICVPTDFNQEKGGFDTSIVDNVVEDIIKINPHCLIVIKSTLPIGHSKKLSLKYKDAVIIFSPEFSKEGFSLIDNLAPSRIIIGLASKEDRYTKAGQTVSELLIKETSNNPPLLFTSSSEAEAIKLMSNTYLAMRVSFFNEIDTYCLEEGLDPFLVIKGIGLDPRIGSEYNNPSFGYGGYCLPKDSKQLLSQYGEKKQKLISAIVDSNKTRIEYIASKIMNLVDSIGGIKKDKIIGVYKLGMKKTSDNSRNSATLEVIKILSSNNYEILVYQPGNKAEISNKIRLIKDLKELKQTAKIIIVDHYHHDLDDYKGIVFSRDTEK